MTSIHRLEAPDFVYRFVDTALGWSVVLQVQWWLPSAPDTAAVNRIAANLGSSALHRKLVVSPIPFARPHWVRSTVPLAAIVDPAAVASADAAAWWNDELYGAPLDAEAGRSWQLRGARVDDGRFLLSLTALHLVADGKTMVSAALAAIAGDLPVRPSPSAGNVLADALDAAGQVATAGIGIGKAVAASLFSDDSASAPTPALPVKSPLNERAPTAAYAWATVSVDGAAWEAAAKAHGGTPNSLFIAVVSGVLRTSGYAPIGDGIKVGVPVSQRTDGDERGNATAGVSVILVDEPIAGGDLAGIRAKCKQAFTTLAEGRRPAMMHLQPLMNLLPAQLVVKAVASGSGIPDAVTSNLGQFPAEVSRIGGIDADTVAFRGIAQNVDPALPYRFGEGVQSWLLEVGDTVTFSVVAFDEHHFPDDSTLQRLLSDELAGWNVQHRIQ